MLLEIRLENFMLYTFKLLGSFTNTPSSREYMPQVYGILRRVPVPGYDLSFVITARHCWEFSRESLIGFICSFIQQSPSANQLKMSVSSRGRAIATDYMRNLT